MSSITITQAPSFSAPRVKTRLRLTQRGRRVLLALAAVPLAIAISMITFNGVSAVASSELGHTAEFAMITVLPGDTLWSLAGIIAPEADPRDVVDAIVRLNQLGGAGITVGQQLAIPAEYGGLD
jgi:hypothetical protein